MRARLSGIAASPGLHVGRAVLVQAASMQVVGRSITRGEVDSEIAKFRQAAETAVEGLREHQMTSAGDVRRYLKQLV